MVLPAGYIARLAGTILQVLGLLLTAWRIYIRIQIRRFWWEDAWAAALLFFGPLYMITQWMFLLTDGLTAIVTQWIFSVCYTTIVMSVFNVGVEFLVLTMIIHGRSCLLKFTYTCVGFSVACWAVLIGEKIAQCASNPNWHERICSMTPRIWIFQFTTDCIMVSILVVLPIRMLWRVKLPRRQRRMILSIFASSVFLALGALFHTTGQILNVSVVMAAGINVEVALSLCVCNLLVIVTYTYRVLLPTKRNGVAGTTTTDDTNTSTNSDDDDDDDFTTRLTRRPVTVQVTSVHLTTVDLDIPTTNCQIMVESVV